MPFCRLDGMVSFYNRDKIRDKKQGTNKLVNDGGNTIQGGIEDKVTNIRDSS